MFYALTALVTMSVLLWTCWIATDKIMSMKFNRASVRRYVDMSGMSLPVEERLDKAKRNAEKVKPLNHKTW